MDALQEIKRLSSLNSLEQTWRIKVFRITRINAALYKADTYFMFLYSSYKTMKILQDTKMLHLI